MFLALKHQFCFSSPLMLSDLPRARNMLCPCFAFLSNCRAHMKKCSLNEEEEPDWKIIRPTKISHACLFFLNCLPFAWTNSKRALQDTWDLFDLRQNCLFLLQINWYIEGYKNRKELEVAIRAFKLAIYISMSIIVSQYISALSHASNNWKHINFLLKNIGLNSPLWQGTSLIHSGWRNFPHASFKSLVLRLWVPSREKN